MTEHSDHDLLDLDALPDAAQDAEERAAGATRAAWAATRADHPDGYGWFRPGKETP